MERIKRRTYKYKTVSLFAGIGGLDLGFEYAGFNLVWANDFDRWAVDTYKENVNKSIVLDDIKNVKDDVPKHEVLLAGFPCQPFSTLGKRKGFEDERGTLFYTILDIIKNSNPKVVVLENVKNVLTHNNKKTFLEIKTQLEKAGYMVFHKILNTKDFGIPQRRNRLFIVAFKREYFNSENFVFPTSKPLNVKTHDLLDENVEEKYFISKKMYGTIMGKGTKGYIVKPTINQEISKTLTATMHKMHRASQDNYFTDDKNYKKNCGSKKSNLRKLTPNECRKLQGFPSDWNQVVSDTQAYKQFGNAVSVDVAYYLAKSIYSHINKNLIR